ncbi:MAG: isoprenylcysteine carboxylmethyltransferase family protein [Gemmatimonadota bacterium]|nr:MAG: isoprenylcysteine carboxylmethyltransferase family protein [Gemmatimonadota bacterium]
MTSEALLRIALAVVIVVDLSLPRYFRRRYAVAHQRRDVSTSRLLPERLLTIAIYAGLLAFVINPRWLAWSHVGLADGPRALGVVLSIAGLAGLTWAFRHLGHNLMAGPGGREDYTLVTTGPYHWVRHPMYGFWTVLFLGYCLLTASWYVAVLTLAAVGAVVRRTPAEEAALVARFGAAYHEYAEHTGRFIPRRLLVLHKR